MAEMKIKQEIENLYFRYAECIDDGELEEAAALFKHGTVYGPENTKLASGSEEVFQMYSNLIRIYPETQTPRTQHVITNIFIEPVVDKHVNARANYTVLQDMGGGKIETIICGQYKSVFQLLDNKWAFQEHHLTPRIIGDMSKHLLIDLTAIEAV